MKTKELVLGLLVVSLILSCGCADVVGGYIQISVNGNWQVTGFDALKNPMPVKTELTAVNQGTADAKDVRVDVIFLYNNKQILKEQAYFGIIQAGDAKTIQSTFFLTLPENFDGDKIEMKFGDIYSEGEKLT
ncbi:hypothetical protein [Methanomicrobium mobile]|uniref:hypothetical protein n=1 Tax=Methanomicrobium mobile TaxID=2205 RepID=UPI0005B27D62|nr:hypothetical protein [Methanomicrobium mobile]